MLHVHVCTVVQEYESAERCVDRVLQMEPNNYQAQQLKELIIKKLRRGQQRQKGLTYFLGGIGRGGDYNIPA